MLGRARALMGAPAAPPPAEVTEEDILLELAMRIEPDGGMPGRDDADRLAASLMALLVFASAGHTVPGSAFHPHVQRLTAFLESADHAVLPDAERAAVADTLATILGGRAAAGLPLDVVQAYLADDAAWRDRFRETLTHLRRPV